MTQTIGQKLKTAREEKRLTLEKVFEDIRIRIQYLQALEADDLSIMPSSVQARGYLRNYAQYLDLNFDQLLSELRAETQTTAEIIGPAEDASTLRPSLQLQDNVSLNSQPESPIIDSVETPQIEESVEKTLLPPPKPARRKKVNSQLAALDSTPSTTTSQEKTDSVQPPKRRGRKKLPPNQNQSLLLNQKLIVLKNLLLQRTLFHLYLNRLSKKFLLSRSSKHLSQMSMTISGNHGGTD